MSNRASLMTAAYEQLKQSKVYYQDQPVGTVAARDGSVDAVNYDQCFTRDFMVSALVFLMRGETDIVRNFLKLTLKLQNFERQYDCFKPGKGLMPASFKIAKKGDQEYVIPDFGEYAIARVTPVDSGFWWLLMLRAYVKVSGDTSLAHTPDFQQGIRQILNLCLQTRFDLFPTLLVPDGSFMIDRRMGVYGYPLEIQVLFYAALRTAKEFLHPEESANQSLLQDAQERSDLVAYHVRNYYWLDMARLNEIYHYPVEQFGREVTNWLNIYPDAIPDWLSDWLPPEGGYLVGNIGPSRLDFRFFTQGNLLAILTSLADKAQSEAIMTLIEHRWDDLVSQMPMKICFPALEGRDWQQTTGWDRKNIPWSYHNAGSWPVLLWGLSAAAQKMGKQRLADQAIDLACERIQTDRWPEYYDGHHGRLIGRQARKFQTWSIAGCLAAQGFWENPQHLDFISFDYEDAKLTCDLTPQPLEAYAGITID